MTNLSIAQQIAAVRRSASKKAAANTEAIATASPGDVVRQGDLYLVCIDKPLAGAVANTRQLAPGSTQGSRHVADGNCVVSNVQDRNSAACLLNALVQRANVPAALVGPQIVCEGPTAITHPEHGHKILPEASVWLTVYQRAYAAEVRRVLD